MLTGVSKGRSERAESPGATTSPLLLVAALVALPVIVLAFSRVEIIDDAYISYRYALNLTSGTGLVFNRGERVEGVTDLLWTLGMTIPIVLHLPVDVVASVAGVAFGILAMLSTWRLGQRLGVAPVPMAAALVVLALYPDFWLTVANGLEGGLFAFLLVQTVSAIVLEESPYKISSLGALLFLTRPDSLIVVPLGLLYQFASDWKRGIPALVTVRRRVGRTLAVWLILIGVITTWRLWYFGSPLPNSLAAKSPPLNDFRQLIENAANGRHYWRWFLVSTPVLSIGTALCALLVRRPATWFCVAILAFQIPTVFVNGGDWMPHFRLLVVYTPIMAFLLAVAIHDLQQLASRHSRLISQISRAGLTGVVIVGMWPTLAQAQWSAQPTLQIHERSSCWRALANTIHPVLQPSDRVALEVLGVFSYVNSSDYSFDLLGLTDPYEARSGTVYWPTAGKFNPEYTLRVIRPNLIAVVSDRFYLPPLQKVSRGQFSTDYPSFVLPLSSLDCEHNPGSAMVLSIRRDNLPRFLSALEGLHLTPYTKPLD